MNSKEFSKGIQVARMSRVNQTLQVLDAQAVQGRAESDALQNAKDEYSNKMQEFIVKVRYNVCKSRRYVFEIYCAKNQLELWSYHMVCIRAFNWSR